MLLGQNIFQSIAAGVVGALQPDRSVCIEVEFGVDRQRVDDPLHPAIAATGPANGTLPFGNTRSVPCTERGDPAQLAAGSDVGM